MATLKSIATGNWTSSSTWALCNSTAELDSDVANTALTTSYVASASIATGAITIDGICVKVASRAASPSGTMSVELYNATLGASVAGTEVTINVSDLGFSDTTDLQGGWVYFKFASSVLLLAATNYQVRAKTSASAQVNLYRNATAGNWSRQLVTTTTQAPAAGDKLIVIGDKTGATTSNSYTVTMNETATTNYGTADTSIPSVSVGHDATLAYGTSAATNYVLRVNGIVALYVGGTLNIGTTGTPIPRDSTAVLETSVNSVGGGGVDIRGGTFNAQGLSRTSGKNIDRCFLNTDEAIGQTVLGVDTDTGWLNGDEIAIASTTRTAAQHEQRTLSGAAGASSITVSAGLTNAHDGTVEPAEILLLTRNVKIRSTSAVNVGYVRIRKPAVVDMDWVEIQYVGANATGKRGLEIETTTAGGGSVAMNNCIVRNSLQTGYHITGTNNITITDCAGYSNSTDVSITSSSAANTVAFSNYWGMGGSGGITISSINISLSTIRSVSRSSTGFSFSDFTNTVSTGTFSDIYCRSNNTNFSGSVIGNVTFASFTGRRANQYGLSFTGIQAALFTSPSITGSGIANIYHNAANSNNTTFRNAVFAGETGYTTPSGLNAGQAGAIGLIFEDCTFGVVSGANIAHATQDIVSTNVNGDILLRDCLLASTTELGSQSSMAVYNRVISEKHDQTAGALKIFMRYGTVTRDTTIFSGASPSYRLTPNNASNKLQHVIHKAAVASGTTATVSVKVRESVVGDGTAYNGARIRLGVRRNVIAGITSDTTLATATVSSVGAFETISGTTATVSADCVLEFYVDCDGTTGWINADDVTPPTAVDTTGLGKGDETLGIASYGNNSTGGGSSGTVGYAWAG